MSSSAGPIRVSRPRRSSALTSKGMTASSTGTADGARTGLVKVILSGESEDMALYVGSQAMERKGLLSSLRTQTHNHRCLLRRMSVCHAALPRHHAVWDPAFAPRTRGRQRSNRLPRVSPHRVKAPGENALLRVQAIFGFVEHDRLRP